MSEEYSGKLILAFFLLILGIVLISNIATNTNAVTSNAFVANESLDISSLRVAGNQINASLNVTLANQGLNDAGRWVSGTFTIRNITGAVIGSNNYTVDYPNAKISFANNTYMVTGGGKANTTYVDYGYYQNSYLTQAWQRSVLNSVVGFFALAVMLISVALFYSVYKDWSK